MSRRDLDRIEPGLSALLESARDPAAAPPEARRRLFQRLGAALGLDGLDDSAASGADDTAEEGSGDSLKDAPEDPTGQGSRPSVAVKGATKGGLGGLSGGGLALLLAAGVSGLLSSDGGEVHMEERRQFDRTPLATERPDGSVPAVDEPGPGDLPSGVARETPRGEALGEGPAHSGAVDRAIDPPGPRLRSTPSVQAPGRDLTGTWERLAPGSLGWSGARRLTRRAAESPLALTLLGPAAERAAAPTLTGAPLEVDAESLSPDRPSTRQQSEPGRPWSKGEPSSDEDSAAPDVLVAPSEGGLTVEEREVCSSVGGSLESPPEAGSVTFSMSVGGQGEGSSASIAQIVVDKEQSVVVAGSLTGLAGPAGCKELNDDLDGDELDDDLDGDEDAFVASLDVTGGIRWCRRFGHGGRQAAVGVAVDFAGDVIVVGEAEGEISLAKDKVYSADARSVFVAKIDMESGDLVWSLWLGEGSSPQRAGGVAVDATGNVILVGAFVGSVSAAGMDLYGYGEENVFVVKVSPLGEPRWLRTFEGGGAEVAPRVGVDAEGGVIVVASPSEKGADPTSAALNTDIVIKKFDADGAVHWDRRFGPGGYSERAGGLAVDRFGDVFIVGTYEKNLGLHPKHPLPTYPEDKDKVFLAKLRGFDGAYVWSVGFGSEGEHKAPGIAPDPSGGVFVTGAVAGELAVCPEGDDLVYDPDTDDIFVAKLGGCGECLWSRRFGAAWSDEHGASVAVDVFSGEAVFAGGFDDSLDLAEGTQLEASPGRHAFIAKLSP